MVDGITEKATDFIIEHLNKNIDNWTEFAISDYGQDPNTGDVRFIVEWSYHDEETGEEWDTGEELVLVSASAFSIEKIKETL